MNRKTLSISILFCALFAVACGGPSHMAESTTAITAAADKATVVFYRPSSFGGAITSAVFDVTTPETQFLGSVKMKGKVVAQLPAGEHVFMVLGENADFSYATLEAGKIYYMRIQVRMGVMKARFSLNPMAKSMLAEAKADVADCTRYDKTAESDVWFQEHRADVDDKKTRYYAKWMEKPESERPRLLATDGE
ncbi:MAG: hypothetical protein JXX29_07365 [Deltaproteobacteria bacterium]|nr:hypothetical protein [Deltaproteobacteria bacterium]MBN2671474.1 hypothetical protein [Deltaproteobacteria bacterium]